MIGKYQYLYKCKKGGASLIKLLNYFHEGDDFWEVLFYGESDVERFDTLEEAEEYILKELSGGSKIKLIKKGDEDN
jgi:hypothetical protein